MNAATFQFVRAGRGVFKFNSRKNSSSEKEKIMGAHAGALYSKCVLTFIHSE